MSDPRTTLDDVCRLLEAVPLRIADALAAGPPEGAAAPAFAGESRAAGSAATADDALSSLSDLGHAAGGPLGELAAGIDRAVRLAAALDRLGRAMGWQGGAVDGPEPAATPADVPGPIIMPVAEADVLPALPAAAPFPPAPEIIDAEWSPAPALSPPAGGPLPQLEYRPHAAAEPAAEPPYGPAAGDSTDAAGPFPPHASAGDGWEAAMPAAEFEGGNSPPAWPEEREPDGRSAPEAVGPGLPSDFTDGMADLRSSIDRLTAAVEQAQAAGPAWESPRPAEAPTGRRPGADVNDAFDFGGVVPRGGGPEKDLGMAKSLGNVLGNGEIIEALAAL